MKNTKPCPADECKPTGSRGPRGYQGDPSMVPGPPGCTGLPGKDGKDGKDGVDGKDGLIHSVVAGTNVTVDATDPANPIVSATGGVNAQFVSASGIVGPSKLVKTLGPKGSLPDSTKLGFTAGDDPDFQTMEDVTRYISKSLIPPGLGLLLLVSPGVVTVPINTGFRVTTDITIASMKQEDATLSDTTVTFSIPPTGSTNISVPSGGILTISALEVFVKPNNGNHITGIGGFIAYNKGDVTISHSTLHLNTKNLAGNSSRLLIEHSKFFTDYTRAGAPVIWVNTDSTLYLKGKVEFKNSVPRKGIALQATNGSTVSIQGEANIDSYFTGIRVDSQSVMVSSSLTTTPHSSFNNLVTGLMAVKNSHIQGLLRDIVFTNVDKETNIPIDLIAIDGSYIITNDVSIPVGKEATLINDVTDIATSGTFYSKANIANAPAGVTGQTNTIARVDDKLHILLTLTDEHNNMYTAVMARGATTVTWKQMSAGIPTTDGDYKLHISSGVATWVKLP